MEGTMKKLLVALSLIMISGCASSNMIAPNKQPSLKPEPKKSTLVIIRSFSAGSNVVFSHYMDGKFIGETKAKTYFVSQVPAGKHYLMGCANNTATVQMDFIAGKIYYLCEGYAWPSNTTGFTPIQQEKAKEILRKCTYLEIDPESKVSDMNPKEYQRAVTDYNFEVKKNPEGFKDILDYKGQ